MIYIDISCTNNKITGIGKTINSIVEAFASLKIKYHPINNPTGPFFKELWEYNFYMRKYCKKNLSNDDIFLIPNNLSKYLRLPHKRTWVLVHDLIPLSKFGYKGFKRFLYKWKMNKIKQADRIITISETVKKQIIDTFDINPCKIKVLYWPTETYNETISYFSNISNKNPYILSIGTGEPRKNIESIIKAWSKVAPDDYNLVLFGKEWQKGSHEKLKSIIYENNIKNKVHLLGKVTQDELDNLYCHAKSFIFPSLEEGFGLPPLEAITRGIPIILPKTPINYELYGEIAFMYSIGNTHELKNAIYQSINFNNSSKLQQYSTRFSRELFLKNINSIFNEKKNIDKWPI